MYLDVCVICRPFDDQQQLRIRIETNALYLILRRIEIGRYRAAVSPVHFIEASAIREREERMEVTALLERLAIPELVKQATDILVDKLGLVETVRFMALTSSARVESVERHGLWQATLEKDKFFDEVFSAARQSSSVQD